MCKSELSFHCPWEKLTKNCTLIVNNNLVKQIETSPMGGTISVIM